MPQTLLLADDSVTIQRVIELTFADEDIKVVAVSDGDRAIDRIDADPPDIVLVDVGMPGKNGYDVARHIKRSTRLHQIPVLLLTGAFDPVDQAKVAEAGCDGVLSKPFEPQLVISRVKELLERAGNGVAAADSPVETSAESADAGTPAAQSSPAIPAAEVTRLDQYFAQLDAAFALISDAQPPVAVPSEPQTMSDAEGWFVESDAPQPVSEGLPHSSFDSQQGLDARSTPWVEPAAAAAPEAVEPPHEFQATPQPIRNAPPPLPPLKDAFAAILAAEQHGSPAAVAWPASPSSTNGRPELTEEAVEEITRRVLARLSDQVVRETVAELVSNVAERLVREEIERIKDSMK